MWGWLPGRLILSGPLVGLGRPGLLLRKQGGWLVLWCLACVVGAGVGLVAWCWYRRHARCCLVWWWWVPPSCCGGGMLSGFWGSAPWLPGLSGAPDLLGVVGGCGWVGCELYSGREHLTVSLRQVFCRVLCCLFL